jgi:signal transduction histidine kinase
VLVAHVAGARRTFLYAVRDRVIVGFELDDDALRPLMTAAFERPLLPPSLSKERVGNRDLYLRVIDQRNVEIFYSGGAKPAGDYATAFDPELGVRREIVDDAFPVMRGMRIETSIHRDVAADLIIGGLPRSPARLYLGVVLLSGALLAVALLQLRREHALARLRSDFVSSVSHELRTPLTQIRMFAETLLLDRVRSDEERRRSLTVIDQEARRLTSLVENVLSFSRRERGTLDIDRRTADVSAIVASAVEAFTPIASAREMELALDAPAPVVALVDDDAIRQVVINLLDNAVKYGPEGQRIEVSVKRVKDSVVITVEDEGPGVPPRDRERIFERYVRLNRETAGAGIGLTVVREIVALHDGRVRVEDGSRFVVTLPVAEEARS